MQFRIVSFGTRQAQARLTDIGNRAVNARPAFEEIYLTILDIVDEIFDSQGSRGGHDPWLQLTPGHLRFKAKRNKDLRILHMDGLLRDSVTKPRHPDQFLRITKDHIQFKSKRPFADVHFKGQKKSHRRGVPARPFIFFTEADRRAFAREILRHLIRTKQLTPGNRR